MKHMGTSMYTIECAARKVSWKVKKKCKHSYRSEGPEFLLFFKDNVPLTKTALRSKTRSRRSRNLVRRSERKAVSWLWGGGWLRGVGGPSCLQSITG